MSIRILRKKENYRVYVFQKSGQGRLAIHLSFCRLCVRIEEKEPELSVLDLEIPTDEETLDNQTQASAPRRARLDNRLLKVWQITTTAAPITIDEEILMDKEAAYGLKVTASIFPTLFFKGH